MPSAKNSDVFNFYTQIINQLVDAGKRIVEVRESRATSLKYRGL